MGFHTYRRRRRRRCSERRRAEAQQHVVEHSRVQRGRLRRVHADEHVNAQVERPPVDQQRVRHALLPPRHTTFSTTSVSRPCARCTVSTKCCHMSLCRTPMVLVPEFLLDLGLG